MKGISVIICCYNSAQRIGTTLKYLANQHIPSDMACEIILVDNCSTDITIEKAIEDWNNYQCLGIDFKIIQEKTPGLSYARESGAKKAKYDIILFCDDDNWFERNYIAIAYDTITKNDNIGAVGGRSFAKANGFFPTWFEKWSLNYAVGKQWHTSGDVSERKFLWGAGLVLRKSAFLQAFSELPSLLTDRKGNELSSGGDSEICARLQLMGYKLYYNESLIFYHFIDDERLTLPYLDKLKDGQDKSWIILKHYFDQITIQRLTKLARVKLLLNSISQYLVLAFKQNKIESNDTKTIIYQLTGVNIGQIEKSVIVIREFYINYAKVTHN
ncbi:MAG: glycosyltransferase family 2 protein [Pedobacter sp.]|nr:MAG: glycosyltransferase family 2 protein [Pedobacter sp.]